MLKNNDRTAIVMELELIKDTLAANEEYFAANKIKEALAILKGGLRNENT